MIIYNHKTDKNNLNTDNDYLGDGNMKHYLVIRNYKTLDDVIDKFKEIKEEYNEDVDAEVLFFDNSLLQIKLCNILINYKIIETIDKYSILQEILTNYDNKILYNKK